MDVERVLRVLLRRWLVIVIGAALSVGAAAYLYTSLSPTYRATARLLLLLPPEAEDEESDGSPFLYLPNGLDVLARVVAAAPQSVTFTESLTAQGLVATFEVAVDPASPIITIEVEGGDPQNVLATRDGVVEALEAELARVQEEEGVPERQTARARVFAAEETPTMLSGDRTRVALAVIGAGGLLTLAAAFAVDWLANGRTAGRSHRRSVSPTSPAAASTAAAGTGAEGSSTDRELVGGTDGRG